MNSSSEKPYVFVSYAHANSDRVLLAIEMLKNSGVNVWYDNGIVAGSEWPEFIAEKVVSCHKFILFVSNAYIVSQNCKRELNFAISRKKEILTIFLEDVDLSPGMEMQLGTYQAINRNRFSSDSELFVSLCKEPFFNDCKVTTGGNTYEQPNPFKQQEPINTHRNFASQQIPVQPISPRQMAHSPVRKARSPKSKMLTMLLAFFLGSLGIQYFYLGGNALNYIKGVACILFCWTYIPSIWGIIMCIRLCFMKEFMFEQKFVK